MQIKFPRNLFISSNYIRFITTLILVVIFQIGLCSLWAGEKIESALSLSEALKLALEFNSQRHADGNFLPPGDVVFLVKKYYYQIQTQIEQLETSEEVRDHFQKAVDKSEKIFEEEEGGVSQSDITKLKLGLSNTLNDIIGLTYSVQIARLHLEELIGKEIRPDGDIIKTDIEPLPFTYINFEVYLKSKNLSLSSRKEERNGIIDSSKTFATGSLQLGAEDRLMLHKNFITAKEANAKVILGKKNRKITRALLIAEVANYDFGIGDSQDLFEALIVYTRVLIGYLDSVYTLNVAVAKLEKLTDAIYKK